MNNQKVLVVEDSMSLQVSVKQAVERMSGLEVISAKDLSETRKILEDQKENIFVAVLDLHLPDAMGGEIVDLAIHEGIPPIILTAADSDLMHKIMLKKPVIDYVLKRNMNEIQYLGETIRRLLENLSRSALIVDDSPSARSLIRGYLERQFLNVLEASSGQEALRLLSLHQDISLMITDYNMPDMNGDELIVKTREIFSRNDLAIVGVSASTEEGISVKLLKSGANDFLNKPFAYEEFYCRVIQNLDSIASYRKLEIAAVTDYLTGLYNRKYLFDTARKLFDNAKRGQLSLAVAILDIDHFKKINDTYGHHAGDQALIHVSQIISQEVRISDFLARIGGEEFCIIALNSGNDGAALLMERIRLKLEETPFEIDGNKIFMNLSIGFTLEEKDSFESMMNDADAALYEAKNSGRNQIKQYFP